jgi:hypothetical protein
MLSGEEERRRSAQTDPVRLKGLIVGIEHAQI